VINFRRQLDVAENKSRADLTFRMLERWTSEPLRKARLVAWDTLRKSFDQQLVAGRTINLGELRRENREAFDGFTDVCQFISDLSKMLDGKMVDEELVFTLFNDSVHPWFMYIGKLDFSREEQTELFATYERGVENWYRLRVMGLQAWFDAKRSKAVAV
jgi:hypothetical protein